MDNDQDQVEGKKVSRIRYEVEREIYGTCDDQILYTVRRNGKLIHILVDPSNYINSPATTEKYMLFLEVLRSDLDVIGDVYEGDVREWATQPFEPFFAELAPSPISPEADGEIKVTLSEHIEPEWFSFRLDVVDEQLKPCRIDTDRSPCREWSSIWLEEDFQDDLGTWTTIYDPAKIVLSFKNPEDALFKKPRKVLIDDEKTACFLKPVYSGSETKAELIAYKKMAAAKLDSRLRVCHLYGVVINDQDSVEGLLLTYIDGLPLSFQVTPENPSASVKQRWDR